MALAVGVDVAVSVAVTVAVALGFNSFGATIRTCQDI